MKKLLIISTIMYCLTLPFQASAREITVQDVTGRTITVPHDPKRIVCLAPGTLRLIVYLQAQDRVIAVENMEKINPRGRPYWLAHPDLHYLPIAGPGGPASINQKPNMEQIISLDPDVIFITYMEPALADEVQAVLGIPVIVLGYGPFATFDETVFDSLLLAGKILNKQQRAREVTDYIKASIDDLRQRAANSQIRETPGVYIGGIGYRGSQGLESTDQDYPPFEWLQARNLAGKIQALERSHIYTNLENLLKIDPEIIFIDGGGLRHTAQAFHKKPEIYKMLSSVKNKRTYVLHPYNWYLTNIDTALINGYAIGKIIYPHTFQGVDIKEQADEIYEFLVGKPVHREMEKDYGELGRMPAFLQ
ncbi:ABC transporter substrate-binding protein [Desulfonatronovibrio hydrogenovorans]|uniref:ABC transporter substrate-binding protein n=1 Tax=Desulfonatronovibrio hydrogenovorans TaxID=53245 RepID=UPI00048B4DDB|nr:ABC transporter substrate-binding protein [Desulfonatronovibrio hydrogenovorans]